MDAIMQIYKDREKRFNNAVLRFQANHRILGNLRLVVLLLGAAASFYLWYDVSRNYAAYCLLSFMLLFVIMAFFLRRLESLRGQAEALRDVNKESLMRLRGEWTYFKERGEEYADDEHSFSSDLDLFGTGSLFQWLCCAHTHLGREKLMKAFTERPADIEMIRNRQSAVQELAGRLNWRQRLAAEGLQIERHIDPARLILWAGDINHNLLNPLIIFLYRILPVCTLSAFFFAYAGALSYVIPTGLFVLQLVILQLESHGAKRAFIMASQYASQLNTYAKMLKLIETENFTAQLTASQRACLFDKNGKPASAQIKRLFKIIDAIANRPSIFYFLFNLVFMLDCQILISLERWKASSGSRVEAWLNSIGNFEFLSSLAVIRHDFPDWAFPDLMQNKLVFKANNLGHPLLDHGRVLNDLQFDDPVRVLLITGSNMSGKSTLLRTAGVNLVLAYAGAPVCASAFTCSLMHLHTCMRIQDNLVNRISSFYAELLRIERIVRAAEQNEPVFFLLDEIFKGTNSVDRHTGARALIHKLLQHDCLGLVSTHDLELGDLEQEEAGRVLNFHFCEHYRQNRIQFDYLLRPGISTTQNAKYLMRLAGIEMDEPPAPAIVFRDPLFID